MVSTQAVISLPYSQNGEIKNAKYSLAMTQFLMQINERKENINDRMFSWGVL